MLELKNICKTYGEGDSAVEALKNINLSFRKSEFVAILGPSGCGKTTMLNILGGLDRYTSGDLLIDGKSTELFKPFEWDAYRNNCVGFVFQNYNLIMHQTILENVELALSLSGVSAKERKEKAIAALETVGLGDIVGKKPNQLSGGQMQRVAIARAIVNDPEIILADEPTGALDSKNSVQIVELLQEISKTRLVVMVTHNDNLADTYATRIIRMLDGEITDDSMEYIPTAEEYAELNIDTEVEQEPNVEGMDAKEATKVLTKHKKEQDKRKKAKLKSTSMGFNTAFKLSLRNLFTKKGRTFMTAFAGSIGIIGIALVMSISNGFNLYIENMQKNVLGQYPIAIQQSHLDMEGAMNMKPSFDNKEELEKFPDSPIITVPDEETNMQKLGELIHYNRITSEYVDYVKKMDSNLYSEISLDYALKMNLLTEVKENGTHKGYEKITFNSGDLISNMIGGNNNRFFEMVNDDFMKANYDVVAGDYPKDWNQIVLVVNQYNQLSSKVLQTFKFDVDKKQFNYDDIIGKSFKIINNNDWYEEELTEGNGVTGPHFAEKEDLQAMYQKGEELKIVGIVRVREDADINLYSTGLLYRKELTEKVLADNRNSEFGKRQLKEDTYNLATGRPYAELTLSGNPMIDGLMGIQEHKKEITLQSLGLSDNPTNIYIYPKTFEGKDEITAYLDKYNEKYENSVIDTEKAKAIYYNDPSAIMTDTMLSIVNIISIVLVCFASISLVVSSIMIGIITYVSVVERTKEIGILRSIGARKKDISRVFNAETIIIGFGAGLLGVIVSYLLTIPLSAIIKALAKGYVTTNLAVLSPLVALILVVISMALTFIAGLIPSRIAAKKDPVTALRAE